MVRKVKAKNKNDTSRNSYFRAYMKKRRDLIKSNPDEHEKYKESERQRWHKRKSLTNKNEKKTEQFREKRRIYMRQYRQNKKYNESSINKSENDLNVSRQKIAGRKQVLRNRSATVRKLKKATNEIHELKNTNQVLQRKVWRLEKKLGQNNSIKSKLCVKKVDRFLKKRNKNAIRKQLILHEVLKLQIKSGLQNIKSTKLKKGFYKVINGNVLREYKLLSQCEDIFSVKQFCESEIKILKKNLFPVVQTKQKIM